MGFISNECKINKKTKTQKKKPEKEKLSHQERKYVISGQP